MKITNSFLILVLIAGTLLTYANILDNEFVGWDDDSYVYENSSIRASTLSNIKEFFSRSYVSLYVPMTMLSYMLDYQLWELQPFGYHVTNVLLHILNVVLAFLLLNLLFKNKIASFLCAFIFALHPAQVESVAWISERKNLLSSLFFFLSFISYVKYRDSRKSLILPLEGGGDRLGITLFYLFSIVLFLLALLSKPSVVGLPILLIGYDYFYSSRITKKDLKDKIPFFFLCLAFCISTLYFHKETLAEGSYHGGSFSAHFFTMISISLNYLKLVFYPLNLSVIYHPTICKSIFHPRVLTSITLLALILLYFCFTIKKRHLSGFWILWFFILMLPVMNLIPIPTIYNDRYLYLSILSFPALFYLILGPLIAGNKFIKTVAVLVVVLIVLSCGLLSYQRNRVWHDSLTFWLDTVKKSPVSVRARINLGTAYGERGLLDEAIEEFAKISASDKNVVKAHIGLAVTYGRKGLWDKARRELEIALELDPKLTEARENLEWIEKIREGKE